MPNTESQGRIHTSTCIIAVIPIYSENNNFILNNKDLRIDTFRSSGAGGQHVNTTNSAIRVVHIPSGITVECQDERSQHTNKTKAINILKSKLMSLEKEKKNDFFNIRKKLLGSGIRSDRIRTYNFPNNRIIDHRIKIRINKLNEILNSGNIELLLNPLIYKYIFNKINILLNK
ncbi:hypothetical protein L7J86_00875 [endosymbiont of Metamasius hemipterus]|uniref:Prokaryotic-type class I peptide chain release factors domain-containing protein n=1 Tax=endosymbiont of Metamasius hemipterus TaxID=204627 RepID=A0ABT0TWG7_9GAMM|nr:peptide chain release factor-like protein [Candidatus Nardonella dryophthoridicola]MCM0158332.1 hypothetical protein [endosymbiont of Metamasius hemipterus]